MDPLEVLNSVLTEEQLSNLIQVPPDLPSLQLILDVKIKRILNNASAKESFSVEFIYKDIGSDQASAADIDLKCIVLQKALEVQNDDNELREALFYLNNFLLEAPNHKFFDNWKFLYSLMRFCIVHSKISIFYTLTDLRLIENCLISVLKDRTEKKLDNFIITKFLASYLIVEPFFIKTLFDFVCDIKHLDIICNLFDQFTSGSFNCLLIDKFYLLLSDCLVVDPNNSFGQKQAIFLLSKCLDVNIESPYLKSASENAWKIFITLVDASNEKQLHLIQPCLNLLPSLEHLHEIWRISTYKILLGHTQVSVVYSVAIHIFENTDWNTFWKLLETFLCAINKHEYSSVSDKMFTSLGVFCSGLEDEQFRILIEKSLTVNWCCTAIWSFYKHIFEYTSFELDHVLFDRLISKCKLIPDLYVRDGCLKLCINYFEKSVHKSPQNFIKLVGYYSFQNNLKTDEFYSAFLKRNMKWALEWSENAKQDNLDAVKSENLQLLEVQLVVLKHLNFEKVIFENFLQNYSEYSPSVIELTFSIIPFNKYDRDMTISDTLKTYICNRVDKVSNNDKDLSHFSSFLQNNVTIIKTCKDKAMFFRKVISIIKEFDLDAVNKNYVALTIMFYTYEHKYCAGIVHDCIKDILELRQKVDEKTITTLTALLLKAFQYRKYFSDRDLEFLEKIFDDQISDAIIIVLHNMSFILRIFLFSETAISFLDKVEAGLWKIRNADLDLFQKMVEPWIKRSFHGDSGVKLLLNKTQTETLVKFTENLIELDRFDISYVETVLSLIRNLINLKQSSDNALVCVHPILLFVPLICQLILYGNVINKSDRVDYYIYQEIYKLYPTTNAYNTNPNMKCMCVRIFAIDTMLYLIRQRAHIADKFVEILLEKCKEHFSKRYFPNSQIHIRKLRILQALILLSPRIDQEKTNLMGLIQDSLLLESHQPSVKHLMQWLLIILLRNESEPLTFIENKIKQAISSRPSSVACFIPVLYNLVDESSVDKALEILLPLTMGSQFKLRAFSQAAISKLRKFTQTDKQKSVVDTVDSVILSSGDAFRAAVNMELDFLEYISTNDIEDCSTIYYKSPKLNGVDRFEWENLLLLNWNDLNCWKFAYTPDESNVEEIFEDLSKIEEAHSNVQKKITPWRENLDELDNTSDLILVTSLLEKSSNLGGLSRTCEVFGVKSVVMRTAKVVEEKEFKSLSMSSEHWIKIDEVKREDLKDFIAAVKSRGYSVIGAEQTSDSIKIDRFKFPKKTVLILGNEKAGIPPDLIPHLEQCVEIPQYGVVRSLNVHVAGAVIIWEYTKQHHSLS